MCSSTWGAGMSHGGLIPPPTCTAGGRSHPMALLRSVYIFAAVHIVQAAKDNVHVYHTGTHAFMNAIHVGCSSAAHPCTRARVCAHIHTRALRA